MKSLILWMALAQAADIGTTAAGLSRGCEEVMFYGVQNPYVIGGTKTAFTVTVAWGAATQSHPAWRTAAWALAISGTAAAVWNVRQLPRCSNGR